ncbi:dihydrofolate reductase [bacterium]|nr:dihydrofolate reductase [bacterium]
MGPEIVLVAAVARNGVIGGNNTLLWHIPDDLKHFKRLTLDGTLLMGRKTFESLPGILPRRRHIVISRQKRETAGVEWVETLEQALALCADLEQVFVVGGGEIYRLAMPWAHRLELTRIDADYTGDTTFPEIDTDQFALKSIRSRTAIDLSKPPYQFETWVRRTA